MGMSCDALEAEAASGLRLDGAPAHRRDLAWFDLRIDNDAIEAMNNNAKAISHPAREYRAAKAFTTSMLHCMGGLQLPETVLRFA